uniref:EF-hand domain-containing protein n=1 Tax=Chrysotila carterae TaxID=13221 RepID=A0A7S4EVD6_CHRCT|mmetsp:Transcript_16200/g.34778  ORF Transcript_16200/g.34778 Transcript_16200/m.34778 type:complete len:198 (+) Transcript_16200:159-752(+)
MPPAEKKKKGTKAAASDTAGVLSLMQKSGFTKAELFVLMDQFKAISKGDDKIDRRKFAQAFSEVVGCTESDLNSLFDAADQTHDGKVDFREFVSLLAVLQKGTPEQKLEVIFNAWDKDGNGQLTQKEMEELLYGSLTCPEEEKAATVHQIIEKAFLDMDTNQDCKISLEEAKAAIKASPELIKDYFGQNILPVDYLL